MQNSITVTEVLQKKPFTQLAAISQGLHPTVIDSCQTESVVQIHACFYPAMLTTYLPHACTCTRATSSVRPAQYMLVCPKIPHSNHFFEKLVKRNLKMFLIIRILVIRFSIIDQIKRLKNMIIQELYFFFLNQIFYQNLIGQNQFSG